MLHTDYQQHLAKHLPPLLKENQSLKIFMSNIKEFIIILSINFDPVINQLELLYCPIIRAPRRDPVCMLRSLLLMTLLNKSSITKWVKSTRITTLFAVLTGFDPDDTPGIGTYYDFKKRIIDSPYTLIPKKERLSYKVTHRVLRYSQNKEKDPYPNPGESKSQSLVNELLPNSNQTRTMGCQGWLEDIFITLGLLPTINQGLIDPIKINLCGDGSILESASSPTGRPACKCRSEGVYNCKHPRFFSSHTAKWCHKHTGGYVFGDRYYLLTVHQNRHDFPLLLIMPGGNESDHTLSLKTIDRFLKIIDEYNLPFTIHTFSGDGHHDTYAHYQYLKEKDILPVIPLSANSKKSFKNFESTLKKRNITLNDKGIPVCPAGLTMRCLGFHKKKHAHIYHCPVKRPTHKDGKFVYITHIDECPKKEDCAPGSTMAPVVYIKHQDDPRLFPVIPRGSEEYKKAYNSRSSTERGNFVFDSFHTDNTCRNVYYGLIRLFLVAIICHAKIRYAEALKKSSMLILLKESFNNLGLDLPPELVDTS